MRHHEEFLTEDFLRYAAECKHMAGLAHRPQGNGSRRANPPLRWADWADQVRSLNA